VKNPRGRLALKKNAFSSSIPNLQRAPNVGLVEGLREAFLKKSPALN
jgi:hypothetical protein